MDLNDKVINLLLAQQLKELGIEQKSLFYWEYLNEKAYGLKYMIHTVCPRDKEGFKHFSAFTSDELIDLLPSFVDTKKGEPYNIFCLEVHKRSAKNIQYCVKYICDTQGVDRYGAFAKVTFTNRNIYDENLSNALAKMLILLIEENLYVKREPIDTSEIQ
jgi:hypothetical protein